MTNEKPMWERMLEGDPETLKILAAMRQKEVLKSGMEIDMREMKKIDVITERQLSKYKSEDTSWILGGMIPEKSVNVLGGKRSSCKTWVALLMGISISEGNEFLDFYPTKKTKVLFIDEETGPYGLRERMEYIKKGLGIRTFLDNIIFSSFSGLKLDKTEWLELFEEMMEEHSPGVIFVDSVRRIMTGDENDASTWNSFFTEVVRPLTEKYGCAWVFVHHMRKGIPGNRSPADFLDELRGSSELANYADSVIVFQRNSKSSNRFTFRHIKSRRSRELEPIVISMDWEEQDGESLVKFLNQGTAEDILDEVDRCCKKILDWLETYGKATFTTKEVLDEVQLCRFSKSTGERALRVLIGKGDIVSLKRGYYHWINSPEPSNRQNLQDGIDGKEIDENKPNTRESVRTVKVYNKEVTDGITVNTVNTIKSDGSDGSSKKKVRK